MAAATTGATALDTPPARRGPSLAVQLGLLVALTLAAAGMGWVSGGFLDSGEHAGGTDAHAPVTDGHGNAKGAKAEDGHDEAAPATETVIALPAITTNIASPRDVWVRMEVSIVLDEPQPQELPGVVLNDLLAYIRTVKMHEIEGASGLRHLKEDLEERASIRSDGHVTQVLIRTLLFE